MELLCEVRVTTTQCHGNVGSIPPRRVSATYFVKRVSPVDHKNFTEFFGREKATIAAVGGNAAFDTLRKDDEAVVYSLTGSIGRKC